MAAPLGNKNGVKGKIWSDALRKAVLTKGQGEGKKRLVKIALALLDKAESGDVAAIREFGDRIEGKAIQAISGPDGGAIIHTVERVIVEAK
jgi:hypothetical protein